MPCMRFSTKPGTWSCMYLMNSISSVGISTLRWARELRTPFDIVVKTPMSFDASMLALWHHASRAPQLHELLPRHQAHQADRRPLWLQRERKSHATDPKSCDA